MQSKSKKVSTAATPSKPQATRPRVYVVGTAAHAAAVAEGVKFRKEVNPPVQKKAIRPTVPADVTEFFEAMDPPVKPRSPFHIWSVALDFHRQMLSQPAAVAVVSKQLARAARRARAGA